MAPDGDATLHPDSDSGVAGFPATQSDRITSDRTPTFFGAGEANSIVTVTIDGVPAGTTVAVPLDGNAAFPPTNQDVEGNWRIDTNLNLADGEHSAVFTFEDVAGNRASTAPLFFQIDTLGPRVTDVQINNFGNPFDLFDPKPATNGPTPPINALVVPLSDLPNRSANFLYDAVFSATATNVGHYQLVGDFNGIIPIESVTFTPLNVAAGDPATGYLTINFVEPLPDDRFTLSIADSLTDPAGNALDGESNASQPIAAPQFPSGDGSPGGDFVARFTVDSSAELGVWSAGSVYLDTNGNFSFDSINPNATNSDLVFTLGYTTDHIFAGDFSGNGFDQLAAYRRTQAGFEWVLTDDAFTPQAPLATNGSIGFPVAGDFNSNPADGDEVGVFTGTEWLLDTSAGKDFQLNTTVTSDTRGLPIVGNFDGFGNDDLATYDPITNTFFLSLDSQGGGITNGMVTTEFRIGSGSPFIGVRERPVAGDMDGDGIDDIGLWVPDRSGVTPTEVAEWYIFVSAGQSLANRVQGGSVNFRPSPFGKDIFAQFGDEFALPIVGNFDPPVARVATNSSTAPINTRDGETSPGVVATPDANSVVRVTTSNEGIPAANVNIATTSSESNSATTQDAEPITEAPFVVTTARTETRDATGNVVSSSETSTATTQDLDPDTGFPRTTTLSEIVTRDAGGNVVSSIESSTVTTQSVDPETGTPLVVMTTNTETRDTDGNIMSSSEASSVTTHNVNPEAGVPLSTTNTNIVNRDAVGSVVSSSESSSVTTQEVDPETGVPLILMTVNGETRDAAGVLMSSSETSSATSQFADPETGALTTTENTSTVNRDAAGNVLLSTESGSVTTQGVDPETGSPMTVTTANVVTRDINDEIESSIETSFMTIQETDPLTGVSVITATMNSMTRDADGNVVSSTEASTVTTEDIDPVTSYPLITTTSTAETTEGDGSVQTTTGSIETQVDVSPAIDSSDLDSTVNDENAVVTLADPGDDESDISFDTTTDSTNEPPALIGPWDEIVILEDADSTELGLSSLFTDVDGDPLVYEIIANSNPRLAVGSIQDSLLRLQTFQNANGTAELLIQASDSAGEFVRGTLTLHVAAENDEPMIVLPSAMLMLNEDQPAREFDLNTWFMDPDNDALRFEVVDAFAASGLVDVVIEDSFLRLTPIADAHGSRELMIRAIDPSGLASIATVRLSLLPVNDSPTSTASSLPDLAIAEDGQAVIVPLGQYFRDVDGDALSFSVAESQSSEIVDVLLQGDVLSLTPRPDAHGEVVVTVTATDPHGESIASTFTVTVERRNDLPVATVATVIDTADDRGTIEIDLSTKFVDVDDAALLFDVASNTNPALVDPIISGDRLTLDVSPGMSGTATINVRASDAGGGQAIHSIVVNVARSNQSPRASSPIREIQVQQDADPQRLDLNTIFSDPDGDVLRYELSNSNTSLVSPRLVDAVLDLLFAEGEAGNATIGVTAIDPSGLQAQVELRVEVADAPVVEEDPQDPIVDDTVDTPDTIDPEPRQPLSLRFFFAR